MASSLIEMVAGINPKVSIAMVSFANSSAGLACGKYFNIPNHK